MVTKRGRKRHSVDRVEADKEHLTTSVSNKKLNVQCSPVRFGNMCAHLSERRRALVKDMGFGGLLEMASVHICHKLIMWMVDNFNEEDCSLTICGKTFVLTTELFGEVMGLSDGGDDFEQQGTDEEVINRKKQIIDGRNLLQLSDLEANLLDDNHPDDIFIGNFLLFACGTILMPTTTVVVGTTLLSSINGVHSVKSLNWATKCLSHLVDAIRRYKKRKGEFIGGCVLFLQVNARLHMLEVECC